MDDHSKKNFFDTVQESTQGKVSEQDIMDLASNLDASVLKDEKSLRQLIEQVSGMAGVAVDEDTIRGIVHMVKQSGLDPKMMEQIMKGFQGK
jgi:hypothetical protein